MMGLNDQIESGVWTMQAYYTAQLYYIFDNEKFNEAHWISWDLCGAR